MASITDFLLFSTALSSKYSPTRKKSITPTASGYSLRTKAAIVAIDIRNFSLKTLPRNMPLKASERISQPRIRYGTTYIRALIHSFLTKDSAILAATRSTAPAIITGSSDFSLSPCS